MSLSPQKWITPFYYFSVIAVLTALLVVALFHDANRSEIISHHVADVTINLGGKLVREHCTTCHIDGSRPDPANLSDLVKAHPDISPHRIDQLGCTGCHLGEGMALDMEISHGLPGLGARKVLSGKTMQASCFKCHIPGPLVGAEQAWQGYQRFYTSACNTCHTVSKTGSAGLYGPDLSHIGDNLGLEQLLEAIRDPRKKPANSKMPRFPLSKSQGKQISYYLKSLTATPYYASPMQVQSGLIKTADVELVPQHKKLSEVEIALFRQQCLACHKYGDEDGRIAQDISYVGDQRNPEYLKEFLNNPTSLVPGASMPRIPMTGSELNRLVSLLTAQTVGRPLPVGMPHNQKKSEHVVTDDSMGKHLYMLLCQRCHAAEGDGRGPIQPNLATFPRAFLDNADFFRSVSDQRIQDSILDGVPGTSMPGYRNLLSTDQLDQVLNLVFTAFVGIDRHAKSSQQQPPDRPGKVLSFEDAEALYSENCQRCHGAFGTGTGPDAPDYQPRPRNLRNGPYMKSLADNQIVRTIFNGVPGTVMPAFRDHLTPEEIRALVGKVKTFTEGSETER